MSNLRRLLFVLTVVSMTIPSTCFADGLKDNHPEQVRQVPKPGVEVPETDRQKFQDGLKQLADKIDQLKASKNPLAIRLVPDVEIFHRAVRCALEYNEFLSPKAIPLGHKLLKIGNERADQLLDGKAPWTTETGLVVRGFRSKIDNTVQPYGLVVPDTYSRHNKSRCDIWLHGRGENDMEVTFINTRMNNPGRYQPEDTIVLHPYGRYSNAFKFAGEVDVLEALDHVKDNYRIDDDRISIRGFSMGGAGCWQFGVHYADMWFASNPGAGFSETPQFLKSFQKETLNPTWWEKKLWNLYDCDKYASNILQCPTIAYSGELDIQKQAADVMEKAFDRHGKLVHLIGPKTKHTIHKDSMIEIERRMDSLAKVGRRQFSPQMWFTTYTLKYNKQSWITINGIDEHWTQAAVITTRLKRPDLEEGISITTVNVNDLTITIEPGRSPFSHLRSQDELASMAYRIEIDGLPARQQRGEQSTTGLALNSDRSLTARFRRTKKREFKMINGDRRFTPPTWELVANKTEPEGLFKRHNLQGPIDDAFMDSFIMVPPKESGDSKFDKWAKSEFERAVREWRRHFRGDARIKKAADISDEDVASANIVLWGNRDSNPLIAKIADKLPIKWDSDSVTAGDKKYSSADHALVMIYPNPLNQKRYVVLNSGFTYREYAYLNNARQVPMLPDWAVINLDTPPGSQWPGKVVDANFFDEKWQLKPVEAK